MNNYNGEKNKGLKNSKPPGGFDILFVLPSLKICSDNIAVADIVNELVKKNLKANIVYLTTSKKRVDSNYFEPLHISENEIKRRMPASKLYIAGHQKAVFPVFLAAHTHKAKALYLIQNDERLFENVDVAMSDALFCLIPNHIYVSTLLENTIGKHADYKTVIHHPIARKIFHPAENGESEEDAVYKKETVIAMITRKDSKGGFHGGITAINRFLAHTPFPGKYFFQFFGNRGVLPHEINTKHYRSHGKVERTKTAEILKNSDIFIDPSQSIGGGTALAAMSSGCACILPAKGGKADFGKHLESALFFNDEDMEELHQRLKLLTHCTLLRKKLQKNGPLSLDEKYSLSNCVNAYVDILNNRESLPDLPEFESIPFLKYRLIQAEEETNNSIRKDVQIHYLKNELDVIRKRLHHYINLCNQQKMDA